MNSINTCGILVAGLGLLLVQRPANAVIQNYQQTSNPARACQLSVPTTNTKIRPKAAGYRNEGTTNQFVICGLDSFDFGASNIYFGLGFTSMDGTTHQVSCTGVTGVTGVSVLERCNMPLSRSVFLHRGTSRNRGMPRISEEFQGKKSPRALTPRLPATFRLMLRSSISIVIPTSMWAHDASTKTHLF